MVQNTKYYLIWPRWLTKIPDQQQAKIHLGWMKLFYTCAPHILLKEKRVLPNAYIPLIKRLTVNRTYPFKNGQQAATKGSVVWTDYSVHHWPLVLYLLSISTDKDLSSIEKLVTDQPNWQEITDIIHKNGKVNASVEMDELDRWYDEISATHIRPTSYHELYRWLGSDIKEIGYRAFDHFMNDRNGEAAWQKAIEEHLKKLPNLPGEIQQKLFKNFINDLIRQ